MDNLKENIQMLVSEYQEEMIAIRRHLHSHPELSKKEVNTARFISEKLASWGIPHQTGIAGHGIVGMITGQLPGSKVIALRTDMDALPILEENNVSYVSQNPGVMHACGHDIHMASLLGAARILKSLEPQLKGRVKLIFQPSEEQYPGGALPMIQAGALENPRPDFIIGQHVYPELDAGKIGFKSGHFMASTNEVHLIVRGKGGHAAIPHKLVDPVLIAAHIIVALQQIVSRKANPTVPSLLSFGRITGEGAVNVIPDEVRISGTMRTFDEAWRNEMKDQIRKIATSMAEGMGGSCDVYIDDGYPSVYNDPNLTDKIRSYAVEFLGENQVVGLEMRMTAEDFSYFALEIPGCFYRLGAMNEKMGITSNLHTSTFNADEKSIETGMGFFVWIVMNELARC